MIDTERFNKISALLDDAPDHDRLKLCGEATSKNLAARMMVFYEWLHEWWENACEVLKAVLVDEVEKEKQERERAKNPPG